MAEAERRRAEGTFPGGDADGEGAMGTTTSGAGPRPASGTSGVDPAARPETTRRRGRRVRKVRRARLPLSLLVLTAIVFVCATVELVRAVTLIVHTDAGASGAQMTQGQQDQTADEVVSAEPTGSSRRVSFCAVGDNLINTAGDYTVDLLGLANSWTGSDEDYAYNFSPLYQMVSDAVSAFDIAFVNQETVLGGDESYDYQGYPSYNTPDEVAGALARAGFDVVNINTNHTYDMWTDAIEHAQGVWDAQEGVTAIGSYASEEDRANIRVVERNGVKVAFLSYCYGQNGYTQDELPNDYYAVPFDRDKMHDEVLHAKEIADVVVVYVHWGEEMVSEVTEGQSEYASYLAGLGCDLVIGSHAHVIQPVSYVSRGLPTTTGGGANADTGMLCVYGLGDFVSGYTLPSAVLSGMFSCDFVVAPDGTVSIERPVWHALIEHNEGDLDCVYKLSDYTAELAEANTLLARVGEDETYETTDPLAWARRRTESVVGTAIEIDM